MKNGIRRVSRAWRWCWWLMLDPATWLKLTLGVLLVAYLYQAGLTPEEEASVPFIITVLVGEVVLSGVIAFLVLIGIAWCLNELPPRLIIPAINFARRCISAGWKGVKDPVTKWSAQCRKQRAELALELAPDSESEGRQLSRVRQAGNEPDERSLSVMQYD